jgi:hypothetical protein
MQLFLVAGTNTGSVGFFPVAEQQHRAGQLHPGSNILQHPTVVLSGCHQDVVRSVDCFDGSAVQQQQQQLLCVTSGEDAQLALWRQNAAVADMSVEAATTSKGSADSAGPCKRQQQSAQSVRRSPY